VSPEGSTRASGRPGASGSSSSWDSRSLRLARARDSTLRWSDVTAPALTNFRSHRIGQRASTPVTTWCPPERKSQATAANAVRHERCPDDDSCICRHCQEFPGFVSSTLAKVGVVIEGRWRPSPAVSHSLGSRSASIISVSGSCVGPAAPLRLLGTARLVCALPHASERLDAVSGRAVL
jgi:hypothetical protein